MSETAPSTTKPVSKAGWKKAKVHEGITLPSGAVVSIALPNLAKMLKSGDIPNALLEQALALRQAKKIDAEAIDKAWEFAVKIVPATVASPDISEEDVEDLPIEDVEMIVAFATRNADTDAVGHQLGGLETLASFRKHRGILSIDEVVGDLSGVGSADAEPSG